MKIQHIIPLLLLAGGITVSAQTTNTPPNTKTMSYTLNNSDNKTVQNPTESDIRTAVTSLDGDTNIFLILRKDAKHWIQASWAAKGPLIDFDYAEGVEDAQFHTPKKYSADIAFKVLDSYLKGTEDWKKLVEWEKAK
jgi:hypothetical protein